MSNENSKAQGVNETDQGLQPVSFHAYSNYVCRFSRKILIFKMFGSIFALRVLMPVSLWVLNFEYDDRVATIIISCFL